MLALMVVFTGPLIVTMVFVVSNPQPTPAVPKVYVTVYVPAMLVEGVIIPLASIVKPEGEEENVPPVVPVIVTVCAALVLQ